MTAKRQIAHDAALGRFLQADTLVPEPGKAQAFNRYSYGLNNPIRYADPTGHANEEGSGGGSPVTDWWKNQWEWKDRWYRAHGYGWGGDCWTRKIEPDFAPGDEAMMREVIGEAGITAHGGNESHLRTLATGVAKFGQRLAAGMARLRELLGPGVDVFLGLPFGHVAPPIPIEPVLYPKYPVLLASNAKVYTVIHELAHAIDWASEPAGFAFSQLWDFLGPGPLTQYAEDPQGGKIFNNPTKIGWEKWAEAVTVWVLGSFDASGEMFTTSYYRGAQEHPVSDTDLASAMHFLGALLNEGY